MQNITSITTDAQTSIWITNAGGQHSPQPAGRLCREMGYGVRYWDAYTGEELQIATVPEVELIELQTNFAPGHSLTVSAETLLRTWGGELVRASEAKGAQLLGRYGMYVVNQRARRLVEMGFKGNFSTVGGIYVQRRHDQDRAAATGDRTVGPYAAA